MVGEGSSQQWTRIKSVVADALERAPEERAAFLDEACAGSPDIRARAAELIDGAGGVGDFMETAAVAAWTPTADGEPLETSERVGRYELKRRIASGGAGTVYEAVQEQPHRTVALKLLRGGAHTPDLVRRFERESELLAQLQHPGIAHVYEAGVHGEGVWRTPFIAMELVRGAQTITAFSAVHDLDVPARLELFLEVCRAVQHGHDRGIIHRDLKPPNILIGADGHPKVIDFGVARVVESGGPDATIHTEAGDVIGTLPYMSPEQCGGEPSDIGPQADVYALGVVLFELLAGRLPLELAGLNVDAAIQAIRLGAPQRLRRLVPEHGRDLDAITAKALEKEPRRRYDTVSALAADVQRFLDHQPIVAHPPSFVHQTRLFARRHRVMVMATTIAASVLLLATVVSAVFAVRSHRAALSETQLRSRVERVNTYLQEMLTLPDPHVGGEDATVLDLIEAMIVRLDAETGEDPEVEADVRATIGDTLLTLRRFETAEIQFARALALWRRVDRDHPDTVTALNHLGLIRKQCHDPAGAEIYYREALEVRRRHPTGSAEDGLPLLTNIAGVLIQQEKLAEAEPIVLEILERRRELEPEGIHVASTQRQLARVYLGQRDHDEAMRLLEEALALIRRTQPETHPILAATLNDLATVELDRGRPDAALVYQRESWEYARAARTPGSRDWMLFSLAYIDGLATTGSPDEAKRVVAEALELLTATADSGDARVERLETRLRELSEP